MIAIAINLGLSFGHVHALSAGRAEHGSLIAAEPASDGDQKPAHSGDGQADYLCPICMAASAMASAVATAPPALQLKFDYAPLDRAIVPVVALFEPPPAAFRSRAPPLS